MPVKITVDIFSGRPNPSVELSGKEAQEALEKLKPVETLSADAAEKTATPILGYRGLIVEQTGKEAVKELPARVRLSAGNVVGRGLAHRAADPGFEDFFFKGAFKNVAGVAKLRGRILEEVERGRAIRENLILRPLPFPFKLACACAPLYEPDWWNDAGQKQFNNNCYNYATNYRSDTFAQPGQAAGAMYTALTCASVLPAAVADALEDSPGANNKCPAEGHLVALVIAPGIDFHWYRKGRNGFWTHKPGSTAVTNLDNSGHLITDPRTADRGFYTDFCTFMVVKHGHIKIQ
ncbi:MAG TPA: hypothetical protein VNZ44_17985 [Pyrinomonadaceae bacterium]|nr:hypothetical protein [Pyrinomonadaceae bacterium]